MPLRPYLSLSIILPKPCGVTAKELGEMVRDINRTQVNREERLSDCVYEYDKEKSAIRQVPESVRRRVNACVDQVYRAWYDGKEERLTQLVFCDLSTPKTDGSFSVYNDMRDKLTGRGIPPEEVAFIHDANTEVKKKELFSKVRRGAVRVLMGSTFKMGAGTNVQDRIIASHDLDCPWRPRDVGRILRTFKIKKNVEVTDNGKIII